MLKALDVGAAYQPSKRSDSWIKIKRCAGLAPGSALCLTRMRSSTVSTSARVVCVLGLRLFSLPGTNSWHMCTPLKCRRLLRRDKGLPVA